MYINKNIFVSFYHLINLVMKKYLPNDVFLTVNIIIVGLLFVAPLLCDRFVGLALLPID